MDKIELLRASVKGMSVGFPSKTCWRFLWSWGCTGSIGSLEVMCRRDNPQQIVE